MSEMSEGSSQYVTPWGRYGHGVAATAAENAGETPAGLRHEFYTTMQCRVNSARVFLNDACEALVTAEVRALALREEEIEGRARDLRHQIAEIMANVRELEREMLTAAARNISASK